MTASKVPVAPKSRPKIGAILFRILVAALYLFLLAPLLIVFVTSFDSNRFLTFPPQGVTLDWFSTLPQNTEFVEGLQTSLLTTSIVTVAVVVLGVPVALALHRYEFRGKGLLAGLFVSPLLIPTIVLGLGLVLILGPIGLTNTNVSIIVGHFGITIPYVIRTTLMSLSTSDTSCEEAARVLGATEWVVFRRITLPLIAPGVLAGGVMAFVVSFDEVVISLFVAGAVKPTLPVAVLHYVTNSLDASVAALSVVLILFSALVVIIVERAMGLRRVLR